MLPSLPMQQARLADASLKFLLEGMDDMPGVEGYPTGYGSDDS